MNHFRFLQCLKPLQVLQLLLFLLGISQANAQEQERSIGIYGYFKTDIGYNFDQADPDWFDILRVTKLPQYKDQFAPDGRIYFSVRQTRFGFKGQSQTPLGQLKAILEFDLFGVGPDIGQTTLHFRKAYVEIGRFTVGHAESAFTDSEVQPFTLDFGAPPSLTLLRSVQVQYKQVSERGRWAIGLERPGATSDEGIYADRIELQNVKAAFVVPDLAAEYRRKAWNGYIELAGILKWIRWKNTVPAPIDLTGEEIGWGFNFSSVQQLRPKSLFKGQLVYGKGIESHLIDAGPDVGIDNNFDDPTTPLLGAALPVVGGFAFLEQKWTSKWRSIMGYSRVRIYNSDAQAGNAFRDGHYATLSLLHEPIPKIITGAELQWGKRNNFSDGFESSAIRVQFSFVYFFSHTISGSVLNEP